MPEQASEGEGTPAVEQAERKVLGNENYQKAEVVHRFANAHTWFHPPLIVGGFALIILVFLVLRRLSKTRV